MCHQRHKREESCDGGDGAPHHLQRCGSQSRHSLAMEDSAPDITVDEVRMAQNVLRYNVVIVGRFFNKGSWVSEAWRKEHPEDCEDGYDGPPERIETAEERREKLHLDQGPESAVCVRSSGTPPPHSVRLTSAERGNPNLQNMRTNLPTLFIISFSPENLHLERVGHFCSRACRCSVDI